ncbi:hypothetical protein AAMO2058_001709800 [Amorphochlora amoebiformis]
MGGRRRGKGAFGWCEAIPKSSTGSVSWHPPPVSEMGGIFGRKRKRKEEKAQISDKDKAILDLKRQKIKMKNYKKGIDATLERQVQMAKQLIKAKKKKKALLVLKKKKYLEILIERTEKALINVEKLVDSIEYASMQKQIFDAMKAGNECLSELNREVSLEEVEKLMDETEEAIAYQEQVSDALADSLTTDDIHDVNNELEKLQKQEEEFAALQLEDDLPDVPNRDVVHSEEKVPSNKKLSDKKRVAGVVAA